jgi:hypothetical protein
MAGFEPARAQLAQAGAARDAAQADAKRAAERAAALRKGADPALAQRAQEDANAKNAAAQRASEAAVNALGQFAVFTDPRQNVAHLPDRSPFALLPVRVETRFVSAPAGVLATGAQLWVRIYPDDCSVDAFETDLSTTELANAKRYWQAMWRAGGIEDDERAAWRALVAAHGSGRAAYIADTYQPVNLAAKPAKAKASDEILVIPAQTPLAAAEATATAAYWQAAWLAGDDAGALQTARTALEAATTAARAAELIAGYVPYNLRDVPAKPLTKADVALSVAFVVFPPDPPTKQSSWSQAPRVNHLADRFIVLGYSGGVKTLEAIGGVVSLPLYVGPDPSVDPKADPTGAIHPDGADLFFPDELKWLVDFDTAVEAGMGLKIDLDASQARDGFDRLLVIGVQVSASDADGTAALTDLLRHHHLGRTGLSLIPQGTPAHNTTGKGTGYTHLDDADQSFDDRKHAPLFTLTADALRKRDGQWVAEALGVDPALFQTVHASDGADQTDAQAMQRVMWPATLGYWMDKLLAPVFGDDAVENTRWFFTTYVRGRGAVPALRIGGQPYGILPTTAFSRIRWLQPQPRIRGDDPRTIYLERLFAIVRAVGADWEQLRQNVSYVGKPGDAHQTLLDVVGLHPDSVEFHARYAETLKQLFNQMNLYGQGDAFQQAVLGLQLEVPAIQLLQRLGYAGSAIPDVVQKFFFKDARQIANVVDDRPLSETDPIRAYTDDARNYIRWLIDAAKTSLDALNQEQGFTADKTPETLLYLYLRHALMMGYYDSSYKLHRTAAFLSPAALQAMKPEPAFVHVADGTASESRFAALYKTEPRITAQPSLLVSDYITANLALLLETRELMEQLDALALLADASTARLERAFAEHIDTCTYRYDAWLLAFVTLQLETMRSARDATGAQGQPASGVYLGAYAWLEDLRPSKARLDPVRLPADQAAVFAGAAPLRRDPTNGGYVHAPSLTHAKTAAVLRSGYLANATPANPDTMSVNLSSDRVRIALSLLEGIRNGQSLGALLGYRFERGLHDDHALVEVDKFIYPLRKAFPLAADAITTTATPPDVPIEAIEARNVMDGLKLIERVRAGGTAAYPFGIASLPAASGLEAAAIDAEVGTMLDAYDAIADLALAEGVHQAVQGNFERIAATLDAYTSGHFPPEPDVVQTPPSGAALTHRVAVHFTAGLGAPPNATPRATAEPALDAWLESLLPPLASITCTVRWADPVTAAPRSRTVSLDDLKVRPLDVLDLVKPDDVQAMNELDDRVLRFVITDLALRPDAVLHVEYMTAAAGTLSVFEATALVRTAKAIVARSRPLRATDAMLHGDAAPEHDDAVSVDRGRIAAPKGALDTLHTDCTDYLAVLNPLLADPVANRAAIVSGIDDFLDGAVALLERGARFNLPQSGWGFALAWKQSAYAGLVARIRALVARWDAKLADFDARIAAYDALPAGAADTLRFVALRNAEVLVTTTIDPLPPLPATMRAALDPKRAAFAARRAQFAAAADAGVNVFATALANAEAIATADLDPQPLEVTDLADSAIVIAQDLAEAIAVHAAEIDKRRTAAQAQLDAHDAAASASARADALTAAAKALFGDDFRIYPEFTPTAAQADAWDGAYTASTGGALTAYLTGTLHVDSPVDEWLHGVARIRPNMRSWEQALLLAGALGRPEPVLTPVQFPFDAAAPWLALEYPPDYVLDGDRLLYTAQYPAAFDKTKPQCGILLDEWTEVIPSATRDTGITFNFQRPDNEPPQSILLVTPAAASGTWQWDDLVGALNETLDLAKLRAVEPVHVDATAYARLLPATVLAVTTYGISITTALAAANGVFRRLEVTPHA